MSLSIGDRIGRYEILAPVGAGGMSEVYCARDLQLERSVAIKVLMSSRHGTARQLERFQREARAVARITHPHICTIHDVGEVDGMPFLVMELLEGETLAERLESGPLPLERAVALAGDIAAALDAAHTKGVVHRDLKPSNVMLACGGVKLLDFGLARLRGLEQDQTLERSTKSLDLTEQGTVLGTIPYMAPEQVEGFESDTRTDIFAMGVILYEMCAGRPPFEGRSRASLMAAILTNDPQPLSSRRGGVPASLDRIVQKCLAKDPNDRWQSAADLAAALRWTRDDAGAWGTNTHATVQSAPVDRMAAGRLAIGVAAGALISWVLTSSGIVGRTPASTPQFIPITFRNGTVSAARFAPDGDTVIYSAAWDGRPYALFMTRRGSAESRPLNISDSRLRGVSSNGDLIFLRGSHDSVRSLLPARTGTLARVALTGGEPRDILDDVIAADWRPGSDELAVVRRDRLEFPLGHTIHGKHLFKDVRIAPDGRRLALIEGSAIVVLDRSGQKSTLSSGWGDRIAIAWSPSGEEVWFTANRHRNDPLWTLRAVSLDGQERVLSSSPGAGLSLLDVFHDGRALIATEVARMGCVCVPPGEAQPRELSWLDGSAPEALSRDGASVLLSEMLKGAGTRGSIYLRKTNGSDAIRMGDGFGEDLSPDGNWILATPAGTRQHWILMPTGPGSSITLPPGQLVARGEANFLPNGRQLVFAGREKDHGARIYVQDIDRGSIRAISPENVGTQGLATPDGRYVVGRTREQAFKFAVDGSAPIPLASLDPDDEPLQWSTDGTRLFVRRANAWPPTVDRVNTATGDRDWWKTIEPADPAGVDAVFRILITPDGTSYCHDYVRLLSELFVVEGLQ